MLPEHLTPEQLEKISEFKKNQIKGTGRRKASFGPIMKAAVMVLKDAGLRYKDIATELGIHPATAKRIFGSNEVVLKETDIQKVREQFSLTITQIVHKMLTAANTNEYISNLAASRNPGLIEAINKLIEKLQLLQGKPSAITEIRDTAKMVEEKIGELTALEESLKKSMVVSENPKEN